MATQSRFGKYNFTENDLKEIADNRPASAKALIAKKLDVPMHFEVGDQNYQFISYIYNNIMFAAERGFPWEHACHIVHFAHEYIERIIAPEYPLADAVQVLRESTDFLAPLNERHKKQYIDFIFETVLCHFRLYKYVFNHTRDSCKPRIVKTVELPPPVTPLSTGGNEEIAEYDKHLKEIEKLQEEFFQIQQERKQVKKLTSHHKTLQDLKRMGYPFTEEHLKILIDDILTDLTEKKQLELMMLADESISSLSLALERQLLQRQGAIMRLKSINLGLPLGVKDSPEFKKISQQANRQSNPQK